MFAKKSILVSLAVILVVGNEAYAKNAHPNPLQVLSGSNRHKTSAPKTRKRTPGRHYAPLEAMGGRFVVWDKKDKTDKQKNSQNNTINSNPQEVIHLDVKPAAKTTTAVPVQQKPLSSTQSLEASSGLSAVDILSGDKKKISPPAMMPEMAEVPPQPVEGIVLPPHVSTAAPAKHVEITVTTEAEANSEIPTGKRLKALLTTPPPAIARQNQKPFHTPKEKTLFMTFDDGPIGGTENLLRVLREENVEATVFCIGREVVKHPELFQEELAMPNLLVANHTYTHANNHYRRFYNSPAAHVAADIDKAQAVIGGAKYLRLAGRNVWRLPAVKKDDWGISVAQRGREIPKYNALWGQGYFIYGWDVEWLFSHKTQRPLFSGEEMARRVNLRYQGSHAAKSGRIILLAHDFMFRSAYNTQQLRTFIQIMKAQGWTFKTIDDYSEATPDTFVRVEKKTPPAKLRPAQKIAKKAMIMVPVKQPEVVHGSGKVLNLATQLSRAVQRQSFLNIRRLLARKADINGKNSQGEIPLNIAIKTNNAVLVRMLIERGARIFNLDANGMSPMGIAQRENNTIIIRYLQQEILKQKKRRLQQPLFPSNESIANL